MKTWGYTISSKEIVVDEDLPNFYQAIKLRDAEWLIKENDYLSDKYKFAFADSDIVQKLKSTDTPRKAVQGLAWYNLLANPLYARAFNYITVSVNDRETYIVDDDSDEGNDCE